MRKNFGITDFRKIFLVSLCFSVFFTIVRAEKLPFKIYNVADGLAHNNILSIYQDRKGFLWFGTFEGLSLFDGYSFINYGESDGLPNSFVNYVTEDPQGRLWVATNGGGIAHLIDNPGKNDRAKFVSFKIREVNKTSDSPVNKVNHILFDKNNNLWCLTDWGLYRAKVSDAQLKFETIIEKNTSDSNAAFEDADGSLWFGVADELIEIRNSKIINHGTIGKIPANNLITGITRDHNGQLLISDLYNLFEFPPQINGKMFDIHLRKALLKRNTNAWIRTLFADETGGIWLGTTAGLVNYVDDGQSEYKTENGLSADNVRVITKDRNGNLWIGTEGGGVCQLISEAIVNYTRSEGWQNLGGKISEDQEGKIWITQANNIAEIKDGKLVHKKSEQFLLNEQSFILSRQNGVWYQSSTGSNTKTEKSRLQFYNGKNVDISYIFPSGSENYHMSVYENKNGILWINKSDGKTYRADTNKKGELLFESFPTDSDFASSSWMIGDRQDGLWLGAIEKLGRLHDGKYKVLQPSEGLPETNPRSFFVDSRGWLWIGLRFKGVSVTKTTSAENPSFINYSFEKNQLASNAVRSITEDDAGRIYFATDRGLDRFDPNKNLWTHFTKKDGLAGSMISSVLNDSQGFIWVGTEGGLSRFNPRQEKIPNNTLPIYLSHVQIAGENLALPETGADFIKPLELSSSSNNLTLEFVAPNFQNQDNVFYQYKLSNVDAVWSKPTKLRVVTFARLAAGEYRFLVRAIDNHGLTSVKPAVFEFRILPPIWRRWWFFAFISLFAAMVIYLIYRNRLARFLELERVRTRIATDLHDDIGANLTRISLMSEVAKQKSENENSILLTSIADIARESVSSMNDIVWAISPEHDRLLDLTRRMRLHAEEVFALCDIDLEFNAPVSERDIQLGIGVRHNLLLIFKEAVNNAARHSDCSKVFINFILEKSVLILEIKDNGKGFDPRSENDGQGLRSMARRAASLGGDLKIKSDGGTSVKCTLPLR
jgi:ligand-binding sensor domain-containing protein/two-component sensor histidine kinase